MNDPGDIQAAETVKEPASGGVHITASGDVVIGAPTAIATVVTNPDEEE